MRRAGTLGGMEQACSGDPAATYCRHPYTQRVPLDEVMSPSPSMMCKFCEVMHQGENRSEAQFYGLQPGNEHENHTFKSAPSFSKICTSET